MINFTGEMMFLNEGSLLNNIKKRYYNNKIYVSTLHSFATTLHSNNFHLFRHTSQIF